LQNGRLGGQGGRLGEQGGRLGVQAPPHRRASPLRRKNYDRSTKETKQVHIYLSSLSLLQWSE